MFAQMYEGCKCPNGTWQVEQGEDIDVENDEIYPYWVCRVCGQLVQREMKHDGVPVLHALTDEEIFWETYADEDDEDGWNDD